MSKVEYDDVTVRTLFFPDYSGFVNAEEFVSEATRLRSYYSDESPAFADDGTLVTIAELAAAGMRELTRVCAHRHWTSGEKTTLVKRGIL